MTSAIHIRQLTGPDLAFADTLRDLAGWNQTVADWQRFLALEPGGCFLAEYEGEPAGTATTLVHGPDLAWVGMVLVHPRLRRRGIGRALLEQCLETLRRRGIRCVKLDATPLGRPVYAGLGFEEEGTLTRWEHTDWRATGPGPGAEVRPWMASDLAALRALDAAAFGSSRRRLLESLIPVATASVVSAPAPGLILGYGLLRPGSRADYLGPVVAEDEATGLHLVEETLRLGRAHRVFWDIPDLNTAAADWAREHGFTPQRQLVRMSLGPANSDGDPRRQFAITGPESG